MPSQDHPIYKHLRKDALGRAQAVTAPVHAEAMPVIPETVTPPGETKNLGNPVAPGPPPPPPRQGWIRRLVLGLTPARPRPDKLFMAVRGAVLRHQPPHPLVARSGEATPNLLADVLLAGNGEPTLPDEVFPRLRWGGVFAYACTDEKNVRRLAEAYDNKRGFLLETPPTPIRAGLRARGHYFVARKVQLIQPGDTSERFTYHVELTPCGVSAQAPYGYIVTKRVPTYQHMIWRLRHKFPEVDIRDLEKTRGEAGRPRLPGLPDPRSRDARHPPEQPRPGVPAPGPALPGGRKRPARVGPDPAHELDARRGPGPVPAGLRRAVRRPAGRVARAGPRDAPGPASGQHGHHRGRGGVCRLSARPAGSAKSSASPRCSTRCSAR